MNLKNNTMQAIQFLKQNYLSLGGRVFKPYLIGDLPEKFGFIFDENKDQDGITGWFNYKGFTYIAK